MKEIWNCRSCTKLRQKETNQYKQNSPLMVTEAKKCNNNSKNISFSELKLHILKKPKASIKVAYVSAVN